MILVVKECSTEEETVTPGPKGGVGIRKLGEGTPGRENVKDKGLEMGFSGSQTLLLRILLECTLRCLGSGAAWSGLFGELWGVQCSWDPVEGA